MPPNLATLPDGLRASLLLKPRGNPALPGPGAFVLALVVYLIAETIVFGVAASPPRMIYAWGLTQLLADTLLTLLAAWLLVGLAGRTGIAWGVAAIAVTATAATSLVVHWPLQFFAGLLYQAGHTWSAAGLAWLSLAWWFLVLLRLAIWLTPRKLAMPLLAAALAYAVSAMPWWWLPGAPLIVHDEARAQAARQAGEDSSDDIARAGFDGDEEDETASFDPEQLMFDQPRLLDAAIKQLQPRIAGKPNLYVIAFAGDGGENVFRNEAEYAERLFASRFGARGHTLILENSTASASTRPLATMTNLSMALDAIAERADPAEDILLVYFTSHGSADHQLYVALDPLPLNQIGPQDLSDALATSPSMRWKVLVINACYSGGFIDALRDDSTLIITAARSDRTSFGCGSESEITYFGKAFLAEALNQTTSIPEAFALARDKVAEWEARDSDKQASEPQIASSRSIEAKLEKWRSGLPDAPVVEFAPAGNAAESTNQ